MKDLNQRLRDMPNPDHVKQEKCSVMFVAYVDQGEGCDYMISCGKTLWKLEALDWDKAIEEVKGKLTGEDGYFGEEELDAIEVFEIACSQQMPVSKWYSEIEEEKKTEEAKKKEHADKVKYERLKLRFG